MDEAAVRGELRAAVMELSLRSLQHAAKWVAELLRQMNVSDGGTQQPASPSFSIYSDGGNASGSFSGRQSPPVMLSSSTRNPTPSSSANKRMRRTPRITTPVPSGVSASPLPQFYTNPFSECDDGVLLAKTYMDLREYSRAAHSLEGNVSPAGIFIRLYATFLSGEKRRLEEAAQRRNKQEDGSIKNMDLPMLKQELHELHQAQKLDAHGCYLFALVAHHLDDRELCQNLALESVQRFPYNFSCWELLKGTCENLSQVHQLQLPDHFMSQVFLSDALLGHHEQAEGRVQEILGNLETLFPQSTFVLAQQAMCHYNSRQFDEAEELFEELREIDPYRLDHMDTYSNILYVKESKAALSFLAHSAFQIDKFNPKTCCIVGNYYSMKQQHEKAVSYFQRALRLDPGYLSAWTLMGHEYVEMRNTSAAIEAYRRAVDINPRDYRAWYGLGQTYELLQMHTYSLYYFGRAASLRPYDSRMWCAMADRYENLGRTMDAIKCYQRAESNSEGGGVALNKLAKLYERIGDIHLAASYYRKVLSKRSAEAKQGMGTEEAKSLLEDSMASTVEVQEGGEAAPVDQNTVDAWWFLALHARSKKDWAAAAYYCSELLDGAGALLDADGAIRDQVKALLLEANASILSNTQQ